MNGFLAKDSLRRAAALVGGVLVIGCAQRTQRTLSNPVSPSAVSTVVSATAQKRTVRARAPSWINGAIARWTTSLHLDRPDGPVVGRVYQGTAVTVKKRRGQWLLVRVGRFERPRWVYENGRRAGLTDKPLYAWAKSNAFGTHWIPKAHPPLAGIKVRDHYASLKLAPGDSGLAITETLCGSLRVLKQRFVGDPKWVAHSRVAQYRDGFEVIGWTDPIIALQGKNRCRVRVVHGKRVPSGFVRPSNGPLLSALRKWAARRGTVWWIRETRNGFRCKRWRFAPDRKHKGSGLLEARTIRRPHFVHRVSFTYHLVSDSVSLLGPNDSWVTTDPETGVKSTSGGGYACWAGFFPVQHQSDRFIMVKDPPSGRSISAYHPEDAETWYLNHNTCLGEALRLAQKFGDPKAALLGIGKTPPRRFAKSTLFPPRRVGGC